MELQFDAQRIVNDQDGTWLCLRVQDITAARGFVLKAKGLYTAALKKYRKARSLDANAYFWVLCDKLSAATGEGKKAIYRSCIREIGGVSETYCGKTDAIKRLAKEWESRGLGWQADLGDSKLPGCTNVTLYYGSSTYDTEQMSRLIDLIAQECRQQDIETMTPLELERLKEAWGHEK